jgi:hypothetical protein
VSRGAGAVGEPPLPPSTTQRHAEPEPHPSLHHPWLPHRPGPGARRDLASKPEVRTPAAAAPMLAQYIGETDREMLVIAMLTVRHRVLGLHTVSVGCLTSSLVHPRLCSAEHKRGYVAALVMWVAAWIRCTPSAASSPMQHKSTSIGR